MYGHAVDHFSSSSLNWCKLKQSKIITQYYNKKPYYKIFLKINQLRHEIRKSYIMLWTRDGRLSRTMAGRTGTGQKLAGLLRPVQCQSLLWPLPDTLVLIVIREKYIASSDFSTDFENSEEPLYFIYFFLKNRARDRRQSMSENSYFIGVTWFSLHVWTGWPTQNYSLD